MRTKLILLLFLLTSCADSEVSKALRNEKTRTTDEFLIEKRGPLSMPPKMGELPKPNSGSNNKKDNENILGSIGESKSSEEKSELENILLEEIKKN
tara:strand:- start:409 stop:696 length:288 start_codon:yes stop_codon:yes gene_type:complete